MNPDLDPKILEAAVRQLVAAGAAASPVHLSSAELFAFAGSELDPQTADEVREHLAVCTACSDRMLAFGRLQEPLAKAGWFADRKLWAAAALLLVAAGLATVTLRPPAPSSPALLQLVAAEDSVQRNGSEDPPEAPGFDSGEPVVLAFELEAAAGQEVEILVREEGSKVVLLRASSRVHAAGLATLALPAGALPPALYEAEARPPQGAPSRTYSFQVFDTGSP